MTWLRDLMFPLSSNKSPVWLWQINYISKIGEIPFSYGGGHRYQSAPMTSSYLYLTPILPNGHGHFLRYFTCICHLGYPSTNLAPDHLAWLNLWSLIKNYHFKFLLCKIFLSWHCLKSVIYQIFTLPSPSKVIALQIP